MHVSDSRVIAAGRALTLALLIVSASSLTPRIARAADNGGHGHEHGHAVLWPSLMKPSGTDDHPVLIQEIEDAAKAYSTFKDNLQNTYNLQFSMPVTVFGQTGTPAGGAAVGELVYSPTITWTPFTNTAAGTGSFTFAFQQNQFWTQATTNSQQQRMGLLAAANGWGGDGYQFSQLTYTHTLPGNKVSVSVGQYSFGQYDSSEYAGNGQMNFINYALAQNGTQTYANAGVGAYTQIALTDQIFVAGGFQGATNVFANQITTAGLANGDVAWFGAAQWSPTALKGGTYSLLWYEQPSVPLQPGTSQGVSFSAVQHLNDRYALFLRANTASGTISIISTSIGFGGIVNNPFGRAKADELGVGFAWNKTNLSALSVPARPAEQTGEIYYNLTLFKLLTITPDIQLILNPALAPNVGLAAVFSVRTTMNF